MPLGNSITWGILPDNSDGAGYRRPLYKKLVDTANYSVNFVGGRTSTVTPNDFDQDNEGCPGWQPFLNIQVINLFHLMNI